MTLPEITTLVLLAALVVYAAIHYGHTLATRVEAAIATAKADIVALIYHTAKTAPAAPVVHVIAAQTPSAPPPSAAPVAQTIPAPQPVTCDAPARVPTPGLSADWPAGSGTVSGTLVPNTMLPGSPPGEPAWGFAYAQGRYATYPTNEDFLAQLAAKGMAWRTDGQYGPGPYVV